MIYNDDLGRSFAKTLDRSSKGDREDGNQRRRQISLHSFRRFVKTTISDLGYADFSEWFIGHSGSTYWTKKDSEKAEIFRKIEPYLTFLNVHQLHRIELGDYDDNDILGKAFDFSAVSIDKLRDRGYKDASRQI